MPYHSEKNLSKWLFSVLPVALGGINKQTMRRKISESSLLKVFDISKATIPTINSTNIDILAHQYSVISRNVTAPKMYSVNVFVVQ